MSSTPTGNDKEKGVADVESQPPSTRTKLRHFLHPNGRRIHIAIDPQDKERLSRALSRTKDDNFDIHISGSAEHLDALRETHRHHDAKRNELREQHPELYDQFANVQGELDALNAELDRVTSHGVNLNAHFDKWGYSAHIRSYDEDSPEHSGRTTPRRADSSHDSVATHAASMKIFTRPVLRQYFHRGIIWRGSSTEEVMSFELFVDLLYVGIIAINGDSAAEAHDGISLLRFVITFCLSWKIWNDMALIISWFETDDLFQRFSILFLLVCLFGFTTNLTQAFDTTYPTLIGFYLAARLFMMSYLVLASFLVPMVRGSLLTVATSALVGLALWIGSIYVEYPYQLILIWLAMFFDLAGQTAYVFLALYANTRGGAVKSWFDKAFAFSPALNIEHRTERTNAFVTLVFGYTVVAILYQSAINGIDAYFGKGVLGLIQAFFYNWIYFEVDAAHVSTHAIRRHKVSAMLWTFAHLPFIMAFVLGSGALARLVVTSDTPGVNVEDLTEEYQGRSETEIPAGIRWFYCAGFGVALLWMAVISATHVHKEVVGQRFSKKGRLAVRVAVAIILCCLPLAESLDSLDLVGIVTALITFQLFCELWASTCAGYSFWSTDKPCRYVGQCSKKELQAYVDNGESPDLEELGNSSRHKDSGLDTAP